MACLCVIYKDDTQLDKNSQYISLTKWLEWTPSAAGECGERTLLQFPPTAAAQNTELTAAFLRQEVASGMLK
jgi:hypothetical protein